MILDILAIFLPRISQFLNPSGSSISVDPSPGFHSMGPEYIPDPPVQTVIPCVRKKLVMEFMVASWPPFLVPPTVIPAPT